MNTVIPPDGGALDYNASLVSQLNMTVPGVSYWTTATMPNGVETQTLFQQTFTLVPFMDVTVPMQQQVPGAAPAGVYSYNGYAGFYPNALLSDSYTFFKLAGGPAAGGGDYQFDADQWPASGGSFAAAASRDEVGSARVPSEFSLSAAHPNPFNPATAVSVRLPESAELTVTVYNVNGRVVATLADGVFAAGSHTFTFDGSSLASGLYFVRAHAPGELDAIRKLTLLK
ncbi:MAG: hypothetical protein MAG453_01476 [Calditrichaeota bacterium]|nr:hypothetical protein [Calditrichota bacterium]